MNFKPNYYLTCKGELAEIQSIIIDTDFALRGRVKHRDRWYQEIWDKDGKYWGDSAESSFDLIEPPYVIKTLQDLLEEFPRSYFDPYGHLIVSTKVSIPNYFFKYLGCILTLDEMLSFPSWLVKGVKTCDL